MKQIQIDNHIIEFNRIPNYQLYSVKDNTLKKPSVPRNYIESQDRWVENPFHPLYEDALNIYHFKLGEIAFDHILNQINILNLNITEKIKKRLLLIDRNLPLEFLYKKYFVFKQDEHKDKLIEEICLTEDRVYFYLQHYNVQRNGQYILDVHLKNGIETTIESMPLLIHSKQLVNPIDEFKIVTSSNISWIEWVNNQYSLDDMANTIALYRLNKIIESHNEDEIAIEQERRSKK